MGTAENKQLLRDIFAATARGDSPWHSLEHNRCGLSERRLANSLAPAFTPASANAGSERFAS